MNKRILRLAVPSIISNLSVPLLGAVDTILMGHQPDAAHFLGGVAIATAIFNVVYWGFGFLRMGTTGMTAQAFGAEDMVEAARILGRGLLVAMLGSAVVLMLQSPIASLGLELMQGSGQAMDIAGNYFDIRIWAAPATLSLYVLFGWFFGMQDAWTPLFISVAVNVFNVVFNLLFVYGLDMQEEGIAYGTLIAQYLGLLVALGFMWGRYRKRLPARIPTGLFDPSALKRFFLVNGDIFIRTMCLVFVFNYFTSASGAFGTVVLAGNALLRQMLDIMSYIVDGFAFAAESLVGRYKGAGEKEKMQRAIRGILVWGMGFALVFSLVYGFAGEYILRLFTRDADVLAVANEFLPWMIFMPLWGTYAFMWDGIYLGATASAQMRNSMLFSTAAFLLCWWLTSGPMGNHGLWLAMTVFMLVRGISMNLMARRSGLL